MWRVRSRSEECCFKVALSVPEETKMRQENASTTGSKPAVELIVPVKCPKTATPDDADDNKVVGSLRALPLSSYGPRLDSSFLQINLSLRCHAHEPPMFFQQVQSRFFFGLHPRRPIPPQSQRAPSNNHKERLEQHSSRLRIVRLTWQAVGKKRVSCRLRAR